MEPGTERAGSTQASHDNLGSDAYGGTRGYSGSTSSEDAAYADLTKGVTSKVQRYVLIIAEQSGERGVTVAELREQTGGTHHGRVSSALTKHHIAGRLIALTERRGNCGVYVRPDYVGDRETRPYRRAHRLTKEEIADILYQHRPVWGNSSGTYCAAADFKHGGDATEFRLHVATVIEQEMNR